MRANLHIRDHLVCAFESDEFTMTDEAWPLIVQEWQLRKQLGNSEPLDLDDIREVLSRAGEQQVEDKNL